MKPSVCSNPFKRTPGPSHTPNSWTAALVISFATPAPLIVILTVRPFAEATGAENRKNVRMLSATTTNRFIFSPARLYRFRALLAYMGPPPQPHKFSLDIGSHRMEGRPWLALTSRHAIQAVAIGPSTPITAHFSTDPEPIAASCYVNRHSCPVLALVK